MALPLCTRSPLPARCSGLWRFLPRARASGRRPSPGLGAALIVDGADGPMARRLEVKRVLPRFSGEDLDKIIDYLTYVTVPAFMVARGPIVPEAFRLPLAAAIMMTSLYHFSDKRAKPPMAISWASRRSGISSSSIASCLPSPLPWPPPSSRLCAILTFVPFRFVHPLRVERLRPLTLAVMAAWAAAAIAATVQGLSRNGAPSSSYSSLPRSIPWRSALPPEAKNLAPNCNGTAPAAAMPCCYHKVRHPWPRP